MVGPDAADAVVTVAGSGVKLEELMVRGGLSGVLVREVQEVELEDVSVTGARLHGIEVVDASALISRARVDGLRSSYAQGIEVRNSDGRPDTVVEDSVVIGGQEGIVTHVSEVTFRDNLVTDTTMRGIAVTEMSDGIVERNQVRGAAGIGLYCGDMSRCAFEENSVSRVARGSGGESSAGWGLVVNYHASASTTGDVLAGAAGTRAAFTGSRFTPGSPLEPGARWVAILPAAGATLAALGGVVLLLGLIRSTQRRRSRPHRASSAAASREPKLRGVWVALWLGIAVQTFHMAEHVLQVYRVHVDGVPGRGGLAGPSVDAEVVHFLYNAAVLGMLVMVGVARRNGWAPQGRLEAGDRLLAAAVLIQGYHMVEHSTKLVQHVVTGAKVNDGILGAFIDLVWLHYALNLAVYASFVGACVAYGWPLRLQLQRLLGRSSPPTARLSRAQG